MALLDYNLSKREAESEAWQEEKQEVCAVADTIFNLCAAQVVCSIRIMAWMTLLQSQMWLRLASSVLTEMKKQLLEGPINPDGLFGPQY